MAYSLRSTSPPIGLFGMSLIWGHGFDALAGSDPFGALNICDLSAFKVFGAKVCWEIVYVNEQLETILHNAIRR